MYMYHTELHETSKDTVIISTEHTYHGTHSELAMFQLKVQCLLMTWTNLCVRDQKHFPVVCNPLWHLQQQLNTSTSQQCKKEQVLLSENGMLSKPKKILNKLKSLLMLSCLIHLLLQYLQSLSSGPHSVITVQITLASDARTRFVPAGSASVSLPPRLCTWLPGFWSSAHVTPQCTSTTALFNYISAGSSTHCAFYHWRPHLSSDCCIVWNSLPKSVRSSSSLQVFCSRLKTELLARSYSYDWERLIALTTITWLHCLRLLLRVLVVLGLNATLQFNRPSFLSNCCMMQNI